MPGISVMTHSDDYGRVFQILAMVLDGSYPLKSPSNANYPFSFYYASLYPYATIKLLFKGLTIKSILGWFTIIYYALLLFSILEIAKGMLRDKIKTRWLIFFVTLFGGLDWIGSGKIFSLYGHFEWWQESLFNANTQISSFYTAIFWTPHHFLSAYCSILAFFFMFYSRSGYSKSLKFFIVAALLSASFYSSPFAFFPTILFLLTHFKLLLRLLKNYVTLAIIFFSIPPLELFIGKYPSEHFTLSTFAITISKNTLIDKIISFPIFITVVPFVELAAVPLIILFFWSLLSIRERLYIWAAWLYFLITYIVAYSGFNNFSMRGMLVPSFVFFFIFARNSQEIFNKLKKNIGEKYYAPLIFLLVTLYSIGTFKEFLGRFASSIGATNILHFQLDPFPSIYQTAHDQMISSIDFAKIRNIPRKNIYDLEKSIDGLILEDMLNWEKELIRKPWRHEETRSLICLISIRC